MNGVFSKQYKALVLGRVFSRVSILVLVLLLQPAWLVGFDLLSFGGRILGVVVPFLFVSAFEYNALPPKFWFEGGVLSVEHEGGAVERFERWVTAEDFGLETLYARKLQRKRRMPLCGYVREWD